MAEGVEKVRAIKFCATIVRVSRACSNIDPTKSRILNDCFNNFELPDFFNTLSQNRKVRPEGAEHQWREVPPRELSVDLVADERGGWVTGRLEAS